jgi:hypothetical protein
LSSSSLTSIGIQWIAPDNGGSPITSYNLFVNSGTNGAFIQAGTTNGLTNTLTVSGLTTG